MDYAYPVQYRNTYWAVGTTQALLFSTNPSIWTLLEREYKLTPSVTHYWGRSISAKQYALTASMANNFLDAYRQEL